MSGQRGRDIRHRQHKSHGAGIDGGLRHAGIVRFFWILGYDQPARFLHCQQSRAAIGPGAGQDHPDRIRAAIGGQRLQQEIERQSCAMAGARVG
jgi:hypothetical protein